MASEPLSEHSSHAIHSLPCLQDSVGVLRASCLKLSTGPIRADHVSSGYPKQARGCLKMHA